MSKIYGPFDENESYDDNMARPDAAFGQAAWNLCSALNDVTEAMDDLGKEIQSRQDYENVRRDEYESLKDFFESPNYANLLKKWQDLQVECGQKSRGDVAAEQLGFVDDGSGSFDTPEMQ